jgi:hypothetical protein
VLARLVIWRGLIYCLPDNFNVCVKGNGFCQNQINVAGILRSGNTSDPHILETVI